MVDGYGANVLISVVAVPLAGIHLEITMPEFGEFVIETVCSPERAPSATVTQIVWVPEVPQVLAASAAVGTAIVAIVRTATMHACRIRMTAGTVTLDALSRRGRRSMPGSSVGRVKGVPDVSQRIPRSRRTARRAVPPNDPQGGAVWISISGGKRRRGERPLSSGVHAIAEVPLAEETRTEAHDFDALFRAAGSGVFRTLYAYTGGRKEIAEEATAEAFARALARRGTIRDPVAWVYRTAFRLANDELRSERRRGAASEDAESPPPELVGLIEALRRLSPNQRAAIVMRHVLGLEISEIAERMGTATQSTIAPSAVVEVLPFSSASPKEIVVWTRR